MCETANFGSKSHPFRQLKSRDARAGGEFISAVNFCGPVWLKMLEGSRFKKSRD